LTRSDNMIDFRLPTDDHLQDRITSASCQPFRRNRPTPPRNGCPTTTEKLRSSTDHLHGRARNVSNQVSFLFCGYVSLTRMGATDAVSLFSLHSSFGFTEDRFGSFGSRSRIRNYGGHISLHAGLYGPSFSTSVSLMVHLSRMLIKSS